MLPTDVQAFDALSTAEKLDLVAALWDRIAAAPSDVPVPASQLAELERRLDEDDASPDDVIPLDVALRRLREA